MYSVCIPVQSLKVSTIVGQTEIGCGIFAAGSQTDANPGVWTTDISTGPLTGSTFIPVASFLCHKFNKPLVSLCLLLKPPRSSTAAIRSWAEEFT